MSQEFLSRKMLLLVVATSLLATFGVQAAPAPAQTHTNLLSSVLTNKVEIPISVFIIPTNTAQGKDPFFPESTRLASSGTKTNSGPVLPQFTFTLQGISGASSGRLAIINGRTLASGEETEFTVGGNKVKLKCVEINADSATVEVGGAQRQLRLRQF